MTSCGVFGNIIWVILGGWVYALWYALAGVFFFITICGIPIGWECFKLARVALWPFGKHIVTTFASGSCLYIVCNIIWLILFGWELFLIHILMMVVFAVTIIGLPCAKQSWKLARVALWPFGTSITEGDVNPVIAP
ncbi:hypothetical protein IWQ60_007180 [Tieghemiomyces parasiticus]|uniref:Inner membrane component domain-containing protein n=1 Tax=Tieghemiomyces parasiticus TaxID=78921 RepID=A0A9W8A4Z5_9FUNG|nr:hypothetical protein IWQ60_007180 [Tieghemiomyces parasiticus]